MSIRRWPSNNDPLGESRKCKPMEVTVKLRLLLASALLMFVQIAMTHAQETVDVAKITCQQILKEELASPTHDIVLWLSGYYNGKRNSTIINLRTINDDEEKVRLYCYKNPDTTVLDAIKNVLGLDK
jgi:acid stress chaperone HdeB